ncbi:MAG: pyridoxamine 5'-phosphate oxidase family protein [Bryobacterales bacterium]|nr:pyridoxamine 5'-phosphate oxidase family protein [Bryobacterales bacterium]
MKPEPAPVDVSRLVELARETMARAPFPMLASVDGDRPRLRPVSPVGADGFTVYVASLRSSNKTLELQANPAVELCYLDEGHDQVRIAGTAEPVLDATTRQTIWNRNPLLRAFLGTIENPEFVLYRIRPERVLFMREWALSYHQVPLA